MTDVAKILTKDGNQTVLLPSAFRFEGSEVFIRRDPQTGDVILSPKPASWHDFFELVDRSDVPADFMNDRQDPPPEERR